MRDPNRFWGRHGKRIHWFEPYSIVNNASFEGNVSIRWFEDGTTNVSYNCLDRHLQEHGDRTAIIWEGDDPSESRKISYRALHEEVCRFANALRDRGVRKGDTVTIYMPMIPEAAVAMLACARVGAVHSVVFGGFSPEALAGRMVDCDSRVLGPVDKVWQPYLCGSQGEECREGFSCLVVSGRDAPELLETVEHPLDAVSIFVNPKVAGRRVLSVGFWRNDRPDTVDQEFFTQEVTVVAFVGEEQPRLADRYRQQVRNGVVVRSLAACQDEAKRAALTVCSGVDFRRKAAA